ncbi:MAG TPA: hypothetical protein VHS97_17425, partial [Isosphaeraceae bacterium]|nr:hypothetical protein [Isosphaeraceae bacterium]
VRARNHPYAVRRTEMVRAPFGQTPRSISMNPRNGINRKYRPCFEALERKQLLSAGLLTHGAQALVQSTAPAPSNVQHQGVVPDGTGKGIVIITS